MGCDLARWLWRYQSGSHIAHKSGSSSGENSHNISRGTGPSTVALKALLGSEWEAGPSSDSGSGSPRRLS